jgi:phosphate starvation-inducible PhoH-like protein
MSKKTRNRQNVEIEYLTKALHLNGIAMSEGPKKKSWNIQDLRRVTPLTPSQEDMFASWEKGKHLIAYGSAGTGKTFLACYLALREVLNKNNSHVILIRSTVPTNDPGFLPGKLEEKIAQYELPYDDIFYELIGRSTTYSDMKDARVVDFRSTSFLRGITWHNAIVIIDECQNLTWHEMNTVATRVGDNTRLIFCGDGYQSDLVMSKKYGNTGFYDLLRVSFEMDEFDLVEFKPYDVVRNDFVKSWLEKSENIVIAA